MFKGQCYDPDLDERGPSGVLKHGTPRGRRFLNACSTSLLSDDGSILQNEPLPGSSCERATLMKYRFSDRLWRIEFWNREIHSYFTFTFFMHLADAFIQSDLHCIQVTVFTFYQLLLSLGIEPMILALLAPCSTIWATGKLRKLHTVKWYHPLMHTFWQTQ